ncbi:MAG: proline--tRNA ligase [Bacteroidota bacterium]
MRINQLFIPTVKEIPSDATIPSHQLMLRAGLMRPLAAGVYSFLPLGYRVMKKVMQIIREEMDAIGGQEFHLPALNPVELWEETGRLQAFGDIIFQIKNRPLVLAPTHEEVICSIAKNHISSYRELPQIWYQIQTKFRNEPRPRSGVIRGRQFIMKDSYTLDATLEGLDRGYNLHAEAYKKIFTRSGLRFFVVGASSGAMGGTGSQEFMVESDFGEDTVILCNECGYAANLEIAASNIAGASRTDANDLPKEIHTPNIKTIDELADFLKVDAHLCAKSLVYINNSKPVLIFMMGNDQLNEAKLAAVLTGEFRPARPEELLELTGADAGSIGPVNLRFPMRVIADRRLKNANGMISGANKNDYHMMNIDFNRDVNVEAYHDLRVVEEKEPCPSCNKPLRIAKAIEIGHIFKLGTKYSDSLHAVFLDENGKEKPIIMGSYGIGVERIVASHIEQNHDENGIIWDKVIAPFHVHLIAVNPGNKPLKKTADTLHTTFESVGIEVLYDDRADASPGFKFKDADLLGMPLQVIVGERNFKNGQIELKERRTNKRKLVATEKVVEEVQAFLRV